MKKSLFFIAFTLFSAIVFGQQNPETKTEDGGFERELFLDATVGGGLIRNTLAPTLDITMGTEFRSGDRIKLGYSSLFFFQQNQEGNFLVRPNGFFFGEYLWKQKEGQNSLYSGFGAAALVHKRGNIFEKNAFKLYHLRTFKSGFAVEAGLIFENDFKKVFPSLVFKF